MAVFASAHTVAEQLRPSHCAASCDDRAEASESAGISLRLGAWMSFIGLRLLLCMLSESFSQTYNIRSSDFPHRDVTFVIVVAGFGGWGGGGTAKPVGTSGQSGQKGCQSGRRAARKGCSHLQLHRQRGPVIPAFALRRGGLPLQQLRQRTAGRTRGCTVETQRKAENGHAVAHARADRLSGRRG